MDERAPVTEERPWGSFTVLDESKRAKVKRLDVAPGRRLSYQRHQFRAEHWFVTAGRARVTIEGVEHDLSVGGTVDIPLGAAHRVENPSDEPLSFIEVQTGLSFSEDDIERLEDDFGRH